MTVSQQISLINESNYDNGITVTDVPNKFFLAITANNPPTAGATTREITIDIMPLEQMPGGTQNVNTGIFVRTPDESSIKVTVKKDGNVLEENTTNYS